MKLSKNFTLHELTKSQYATRHGIDNTPSADIIKNLELLCWNVLQPIRDALGVVNVSSGYRSSVLNQKIGGSPTSDHCKGFAADIEVPGVSNYMLAKYIKDNLRFKQLILEFHDKQTPDSGWVHISYDKDNLDMRISRAIKQQQKTLYVQGLD